MKVSRRYPDGIYSFIGVAKNASPTERREAWLNDVRETTNRRVKARGPAKSALSVRLNTLHAHGSLFGPGANETSTERVQRHRASLTPEQRRLENAKTTMRRAWREWTGTPNKYARKVVPKRRSLVRIVPPSGLDIVGKVAKILPASAATPISGYVLIERTAKSRRNDRRLRKVATVPSDIFAK